jgi:hypothetical protein
MDMVVVDTLYPNIIYDARVSALFQHKIDRAADCLNLLFKLLSPCRIRPQVRSMCYSGASGKKDNGGGGFSDTIWSFLENRTF